MIIRCLVALGLAIVAGACSGNTPSVGNDAATADMAATDLVADDAGTVDVGADTGDLAGTADVPTQAPADVVAGKACAEVLACAVSCTAQAATEVAGCMDKCAVGVDAAAQVKLSAISNCAVDLCADASQITDRLGCAWGKCFDQLSSCGGFSAGTADAITTAECASRCPTTQPLCLFACLRAGNAQADSAYAGLQACILSHCGLSTGAERSACIAQQCESAGQNCVAGASLNCANAQACRAKCPQPLPTSPNDCLAICDTLTDPVALAVEATLTGCQTECAGAAGKFLCFQEKCVQQEQSCFAQAGAATCNLIYQCVVAKCQSVGGEPSCTQDCVITGDAQAQAAWVLYEGCFLQQLSSPEAKNAGCAFPYNSTSCVNVVNNFCTGQWQACFKPQ